MNTGTVYAITAFFCMLQIALILDRTQATKYKETIDLEFCKMLLYFVIFCLVDLTWGVFSSREMGISVIGLTLATYGYHLAAALSAFFGLGYGMHYVNASKKEWLSINLIRHFLLVVQVGVLLSNLWTHKVFSIDDECNYFRGDWRVSLYLIQYLYYLILIGLSLYKAFRDSRGIGIYKTSFSYAAVLLVFGIGQYMFYDVAMYSLGFAISAFGIYSYKVTSQRERYMEDRISMLDRRQSSIIQGLAGDFLSIYYVDIETGYFDIYKREQAGTGLVKEEHKKENYFESVVENGKRVVFWEDLDEFLQKVDKETIINELKEKGSFNIVMRIVYQGGPQYFKYSFVRPASQGEENKLIIGVYNVDAQIREEIAKQQEALAAYERERALKAQANRLNKDANMDALTGLYNRRAYESDINIYEEKVPDRNFVYLSFDLNHLKNVNDTQGHEAGDELIKGAAHCITSCFGAHGKIYRVGGDEFVGIIFADEEKLQEILENFKRTMYGWSGELVKEVAISFGCVKPSESVGKNIGEVARLADKRMYQDKANYYAEKGIDRRGQRDAYNAICVSYTKILRVNLTKDNYSIIQMSEAEKNAEKGFNDKISEWLRDFAITGQVHEEDRENYLKCTDLQYLRNFFNSGNQLFCIYYRRLTDDVYRHAMMEMIPASDYSEDNQVVFLYVKNIDR